MALINKRITHKNALQALITHSDKPQGMYKDGFYLMSGLFTGILLNDVWQFFNLPGNDIPLTTATAKKLGLDMDFVYQFIIGAAFIGADLLLGLENGTSFGGGIILGAKYANLSEKGQYIGNVGLITLVPNSKGVGYACCDGNHTWCNLFDCRCKCHIIKEVKINVKILK